MRSLCRVRAGGLDKGWDSGGPSRRATRESTVWIERDKSDMRSDDLQCSCNQAQPSGIALWLLNVNRKEEVWTASIACVFRPAQNCTPQAGPHFQGSFPQAARSRRACARRTVCAHHHRPTKPSQRRAEVHELPQPGSDDFQVAALLQLQRAGFLCTNLHPFPSNTSLLLGDIERRSCLKSW